MDPGNGSVFYRMVYHREIEFKPQKPNVTGRGWRWAGASAGSGASVKNPRQLLRPMNNLKNQISVMNIK